MQVDARGEFDEAQTLVRQLEDRAQALDPAGKLVDDFLFVKGPSSLHVCNAPSPAATSSLEIGEAVAEQMA